MIIHDANKPLHASQLIIDNRSSGDLSSNLGTQWRMVTDAVMGGISRGTLKVEKYDDKVCLRMRGDVTTENNGGFIQMVLPMSKDGSLDATDFTGVEIDVAGNNESYNLHLRTKGLWLPWQSYRYSFTASTNWQKYRIPFASLTKYRTYKDFSKDEVVRIGLVAIGRNFKADLCLASMHFYSE